MTALRSSELSGVQPAGNRSAAPADWAIDVDGVTCRFRSKRSDVTAVADVTLRVAPGDFVGLVGPSGCGKSTLLKLVAGLVRPTAGSIQVLGKRVERPQQQIGFVFQRAALLEWRGARKSILIQAEMRGIDRREAARRTDELIEMVGLKGFEKALPHELSGGMQQRVSLCRALLHRPPVLLMDEPFGALDALTREQMNVELNRIWRETGTAVLFVTHSIAEAIYLSKRVEVMSARPGRILRTFEVDLPPERDYAKVMADPAFGRTAQEVRQVLGSTTTAD
jgi:NitT/TauT family transport system ATP-binding protein